jgi:hypothetical protein
MKDKPSYKFVIVLYGDRRNKRFNMSDWCVFEPFIESVAVKIYKVKRGFNPITFFSRNIELFLIRFNLKSLPVKEK